MVFQAGTFRKLDDRGFRSSLFNDFRVNLTYWGAKRQIPVFTGSGRLQSFHIGILKVMTVF